MSRQRWYLDGSPGVGREERHGADCDGLHGKSQQEVKLLRINLALLEQNLKCAWVGARSGEAVAVSHDPRDIDLISNDPHTTVEKSEKSFFLLCRRGWGWSLRWLLG